MRPSAKRARSPSAAAAVDDDRRAPPQPHSAASTSFAAAACPVAACPVLPAIAPNCTVTAAAAAAPIPSLSLAQRLYADALLGVFSFLPLCDVVAAAAACRLWLGHARKEPSRRLFLDQLLMKPGGTAPFRRSTSDATGLGHHITAFSEIVPMADILGHYSVGENAMQALLLALPFFSNLERLHLQLMYWTSACDGAALRPFDLSPLLQLRKLHTLNVVGLTMAEPQLLPPTLRFLKASCCYVPLYAQHLADAGTTVCDFSRSRRIHFQHHIVLIRIIAQQTHCFNIVMFYLWRGIEVKPTSD